MRGFWAMIVLLAVAAGGWVYFKRVAPAGGPAAGPAGIRGGDAAPNGGMPIAKPADSTVTKPETTAGEFSTPDKPAVAAVTPPPPPPASPTTVSPPPTAPAEPASGVVAKDPSTAQAGVVRVDMVGTDGKPLSQRAGFIMASDLVATPAHLLDQSISATVTPPGGSPIPVVGTVALDMGRDVAILKLAAPIRPATALKLSLRETSTDLPAFVVPATGAALQAAVVGYRTDTLQGRRVQIRAALPTNPVGMPIVNPEGEVLGLLTGTDSMGAALVVASSELAAMPRGAITPLTTTAAAAKVKNGGTTATPALPAGESAKEAKPEIASEAKVTKRDDGSMLIDETYVVKGEGTKDAPYEITWEMLTSAQEVYEPRKGQKKLPGRVMMLDGKWVKITGYVAFPMYVEEPKELLSMLNQWDGCCIGVPPTPYDAIEVRLSSVAGKDDRLATFGTVVGKLSVKPYLVGDWLVGMYLMDDAKLTVKQFGGFGS